jgi:tagatose 1,6-diphosphate aldolase GatY/KbaY
VSGFARLLQAARRRGSAVPALVVGDLASAEGALRAAARRPLVLLVPGHLVTRPAGAILVAGLRTHVERSGLPVWIQLDHGHALDEIAAACELGVSAVMADASHLPYGENAAFVTAARAIAARYGVAVEAQLGRLEGEENVARSVDPVALTDAAEAARFVRDTGVQCLGVAVGNVHGHYRRSPRLDLDRIREIAAVTDAPLALHGGSGLPASHVREAVRAGIAKVNVHTELRTAHLGATAGAVHAGDAQELLTAQSQAVERAARQLLSRMLEHKMLHAA